MILCYENKTKQKSRLTTARKAESAYMGSVGMGWHGLRVPSHLWEVGITQTVFSAACSSDIKLRVMLKTEDFFGWKWTGPDGFQSSDHGLRLDYA